LLLRVSPWAITWPSVHEFLAIVTHPKIHDPLTRIATALAAIQAWQASPGLRLLGEGPGSAVSPNPHANGW
jgi:hypothetical protein